MIDERRTHIKLKVFICLKRQNQFQLKRFEPVESIVVKDFKTGAMSYGSIFKEAHETMAIAMDRLHG